MKVGPFSWKRWRDTLTLGFAGRWYLYIRWWDEDKG